MGGFATAVQWCHSIGSGSAPISSSNAPAKQLRTIAEPTLINGRTLVTLSAVRPTISTDRFGRNMAAAS